MTSIFVKCLHTAVLIIICTFTSLAQGSIRTSSYLTLDKVDPINIGDLVPNISFKNVLNFDRKSVTLSDFSDKLVILDLWSTLCGSCIAGFPKMEDLQKQFNGQIQILLVNPHKKEDSEIKIINTLSKLKSRTGFYPSLPIPIHDTILNAYFPYISIPHVIWIDGNRKLIGITSAREVNAVTIRNVLNGRYYLPTKNDWAVDNSKPLFIDGNGGEGVKEDVFLYRSFFSKYIPGIGAAGSNSLRFSNNRVTGYSLYNASILFMTQLAYAREMEGIHSYNRIIFDVKKPEKFKADFDSLNTFCYDLIIPPVVSQKFDEKEYLKEDLRRVFNISVRKESRLIECFTLKYIGNSSTYISNSPSTMDLDRRSIKKFIHRYTIKNAIEVLDAISSVPLIPVDVDSRLLINIEFPDNFDLTNTGRMLDFLKKNGFDIRKQTKELEVIIITDK